MMTTIRRGFLLTCCFAVIPGISKGATQEHVGSWVISWPVDGSCQMRFAARFLDKSGVTGDLEIEAQGNTVVRVLALRGLPTEALMAAGYTEGLADLQARLAEYMRT